MSRSCLWKRIVKIWIPVNVAIVLVEAEIVFGIFNVVVDLFVADCNDERHEVLVMGNGQGILVHLFVCEVVADECFNSSVNGVECVFAVLTVVVVVVFLIGDFGVRTPAPASATFAVACILVGLDVPRFFHCVCASR